MLIIFMNLHHLLFSSLTAAHIQFQQSNHVLEAKDELRTGKADERAW